MNGHSMDAWVVEEYGGPDAFERTEVDRPTPGPEEVLLRVRASSVNPVDAKIRRGDLPAFAPDSPRILGCDVAGVVEAVGDDVTAFEAGDEVYGMPGGVTGSQGALADYQVAHADTLAPVPNGLSLREAATLPVVGLTAWELLVDSADVGEDDSVLVYGGTGGVGHAAVQVARWCGARKVVATGSSARKRELAVELGADATVDYGSASVEEYVAEHTDGEGFDVVVDTVGNDHLPTAFEAVAPYGTVLTTETSSSGDVDFGALQADCLTLGVTLAIRPVIEDADRSHIGTRLRRLSRLVENGRLEPLVDERTFAFAEVSEAHARLEAGEAVGKISLVRER
ncbi:zinc-dependent alcohol dehydrogenase family protein [Halobium salinum]|uniref:Zinc-dependent alcohol dehydrogenase family protein n=1 Tax=Halobium salinum TaxID=1364940 RepID=A0ABD5P9B3_9EURY|nr:zinc-dependent alcohol dehydrogenase family protein [Halobium salinum]